MKLNYTSLQHAVAADRGPSAGAAASSARSRCSRCTASSRRSRGRSRRAAPGRRLGYVQTEGGALAGGHSRTVRALRERGLLAGHLTAGAAFGGEGEAITTAGALHHGLRTLGWDAAVCGPGPGIVGSSSPLGHGGMVALDSAHVGARARLPDAARRAHVLGRSARAPPRHLPPHADRARPAARAGHRRAARRHALARRLGPARGARRGVRRRDAAAGPALALDVERPGAHHPPRLAPRGRRPARVCRRAGCRARRWGAGSRRTRCSSARRSPAAPRSPSSRARRLGTARGRQSDDEGARRDLADAEDADATPGQAPRPRERLMAACSAKEPPRGAKLKV